MSYSDRNIPCCLAGKMACPPEDVGGIPGFYNFVEVMANKKHPEHKDMTEWFMVNLIHKNLMQVKLKFHNAKIRLKIC